MKKRDRFWLNKILSFLGVMLIFAVISLYNIILFNNSYMEEENEELIVFKKQVEWVIIPYLKAKDYKTIQKYCDDFKDEDITFRLFDADKKLIAATRSFENAPMIEEDSSILKKRQGKLKIYRHSIREKMIGVVSELEIGGSRYYLELTISEEDVIKSILKSQRSIVIFFGIYLIFLIAGLIQIFHTLRTSFNQLEDSVIEIANGNLDRQIDVPKIGILQELTLSIKKMVQRLKNQIDRLTQLEKYKTDFIQNVSHEIKTPITAINSAVELLSSGNDISPMNKECMEIIQFQTNALNKLMQDILCLSEVDLEKTNGQKTFETFKLNNLIESIINHIAPANIKINFNPAKTVSIYADEALISTAVTNLIINAVKYSGSSSIDVLLLQEDNNVQIKVKDYGIGIPEEHLGMIFEKFYRVDKARSRQTGGTGLGLAIVKDIIDLHNGTISVESIAGHGTTFTISLPLNHIG